MKCNGLPYLTIIEEITWEWRSDWEKSVLVLWTYRNSLTGHKMQYLKTWYTNIKLSHLKLLFWVFFFFYFIKLVSSDRNLYNTSTSQSDVKMMLRTWVWSSSYRNRSIKSIVLFSSSNFSMCSTIEYFKFYYSVDSMVLILGFLILLVYFTTKAISSNESVIKFKTSWVQKTFENWGCDWRRIMYEINQSDV